MKKMSFVKKACAVLVLCAATAITLRAQTFGVLHSFDITDGATPIATMIQASDGNLYGTTRGYDAVWGLSYGTVFKLSAEGRFTTLYSFCSQSNCTDGSRPSAALIQATDGNFYGTTYQGGAYGSGTVFKITPSGALTTLYSFCAQANCPDGAMPVAPLIQAADGNLYGTTSVGGVYWGTVFKITTSGTLTTLYSFCAQSNCADGAWPNAGLIQAADGNFYGTTTEGCVYLGPPFLGGTVFEITPSGMLTTLHCFCSQSSCTDGTQPYGALIQATDGNFYGTTGYGGASNDGTIFKITPTGALNTLYNFCSQSGCADGAGPASGLIQATDGNLYGTTMRGGLDGEGAVFRLTLNGALTTLHSFDGTDGSQPQAGLVQGTNGRFYGTAQYGGTYGRNVGGYGTVFLVSTGLAPFVETEPNHGKVGRVIRILGTNLGGASSVTFNGTPAVFEVISNSLIGAIVPAAATTGTVQVTTPSGVFSSNVPFQVMP